MELITNPDSNSDEFALVMTKDDLLVILGTIGHVYDNDYEFDLSRKVGMLRDDEWSKVAFALTALACDLGLLGDYESISGDAVAALKRRVEHRRPEHLNVTSYDDDTWLDTKSHN